MLFGHLAVIEIAFSSHRVEHSRCRLPESWIAKKIVLTTKELQV